MGEFLSLRKANDTSWVYRLNFEKDWWFIFFLCEIRGTGDEIIVQKDSRHGIDNLRSLYNLGDGENSLEAKHSIKWSSQNIEISYDYKI